MATYCKYVIFVFIGLTLFNCGGGSGDGDTFVGAGRVSLQTQPSTIDVGDRTLVSASISNVNDDGIMVKFRIPAGLVYVLNTAFLEVDDREIDIGPDVNVEVDSENFVYIVFFLSQSIFGEQNRGVLTLQLEGVDSVGNGQVAVDIDVDDPLINNPGEFDAQSPEFQVEDEVDIKVEA